MTKNKKTIFCWLGILTTCGPLLTSSCLTKKNRKTIAKYTTQGSKITDGSWGTFFEDSYGNLWATALGKGLQVLTKNKDGSYASSWSTNSNHKLLKGSNIINGAAAVFFEDSHGNLWSMGHKTPLQVLVKKADGNYAGSWHSDRASGLTKGSNIIDGSQGAIFEDSGGNLWAIGADTPLQVLVKKMDGNYADAWHSDRASGLTKGSWMHSGVEGQILKDSSGNIWAAGENGRIQVLMKKADGTYANSWHDDVLSGLTKGSHAFGVVWRILEDSSDNIWAMTTEEPLQVLVKSKKNKFVESWTSDTSYGLTKDSNISDGHGGVIFEDSKGNLWAMGRKSPLQVLVKKADGNYVDSWNSSEAQKLLAGSNIKDGILGIIFEDKNGNIFSVGYKTPLQVLAKKPDGSFASSWTSNRNHPLLKGSNVPSSYKARIFLDSKGNIWAMVPNRPIQVW